MDLGALINQSLARIRSNPILLVPPILTQVILPLALLTVAAFTMFPVAIAFGLTGDLTAMLQAILLGGLSFGVVGFVAESFLAAGWMYMNKRVVLEGHTDLADLWVGAKKYFPRILAGRIVYGLVLLAPIAVALTAVMTTIFGYLAETPVPPEQLTQVADLSLLAPVVLRLAGVLLVLGLVELVLSVFLLPWMQALVVDDVGVWKSMKTSFVFVRRNLPTIIGYLAILVVISVLASSLSSFVWPGITISELAQPGLYANGFRLIGAILEKGNLIASLIQALVAAFFTLLLFFIYVDRTRALIAESPGSYSVDLDRASLIHERPPTRRVPVGTKYCVNCGASLISVAVFCPECGARQPPLTPE
jgi:hypothetical protein